MIRKSVAKIISWNTNNDAVCASAAKMSTTKGNAIEIFERTKGNPQNTELIKKVLRSGHKSVIEHAVFSIAFWDVSAFVEQYLIECRLASFTVKSRRYVDFSNLGYLVPQELSGESLERYRDYMDFLFHAYSSLLAMGIPKEDARFLLPYSFCSNFYCTMNARELVNLINSIRNGRGRMIPELQELAQQIVEQIAEIFPALMTEFDYVHPAGNVDAAYPHISVRDHIEFLGTDQTGKVQLLQAPTAPLEILKCAFQASASGSDAPFDLARIVASDRPRELEQLSYTFKISDLTLSGITHLVRHRMQSIIIPSIQGVDHSRFIIPDTVLEDPTARAYYMDVLAQANQKLLAISRDAVLAKYGYYFAISGNVMDIMTTVNARELMLFIRLRACNRAQWEIRNIAKGMLNLLRADFPELYNHYGPSCVLNGSCPEGKMTCGKKEEMQRLFGEN